MSLIGKKNKKKYLHQSVGWMYFCSSSLMYQGGVYDINGAID